MVLITCCLALLVICKHICHPSQSVCPLKGISHSLCTHWAQSRPQKVFIKLNCFLFVRLAGTLVAYNGFFFFSNTPFFGANST